MAFNGSGTFLINTAGQPVVSGTVISSTAFNALTADLATGLSTAITKDGQTTVTANIPMSTYKFTGLGVGSAATDSANLSQVQSTVTKLLNSVSGADTITATASPTLAAYAAGQMFYFVAAGDNTTSVTLNIDALGAKAVTRDGSVALAAADIKSGEVIVVVYDGTRFQVVSQLNSAGDARFANVSIASSLYVGGVSTFVGNAGFSANVSIASALSVGGVAAITGATTIGGNLTLSGSTANGVAYLNGSKVLTSGSALTFDGTYFTANGLRLAGTDVTNTIYQATGALGISTGSASGITFYTNLANRYQIDATGVAVWSVGGSESMRLNATGLGLGTASPAQRLHINTATTYQGILINGNQAPSVCFATSTNTTPAWKVGLSGNNSANFAISSGAAATDAVTINSSGNLGIGTASWPSGQRLRVAGGDVGFEGQYLYLTNADANIQLGAAQNVQIINSDSGNLLTISRTGASSAMAFSTAGSERIRITPTGLVGIGTASPSFNFQVSGTQSVGFSVNSTYGGPSILSSGSNNLFIQPNSQYTTFGGNGVSFAATVSVRAISGAAGFSVEDSTASNSWLFVNSSGNVGIGTASPSVKLEVNGQIRTAAPTGGTAANWRLGTVHTVSPTSPNRTIEVDIGGTIYYLHAKTTNN